MGGAVQAVAVSASGGLGLRRWARAAGSSDILGLDKWRVVSPTRAFVIDDGGHIRVSELRTERGHHGGVCDARNRLTLESVQNRPQMLRRIPRLHGGATGEGGEYAWQALTRELVACRAVVAEDLSAPRLPIRLGGRGARGTRRGRDRGNGARTPPPGGGGPDASNLPPLSGR